LLVCNRFQVVLFPYSFSLIIWSSLTGHIHQPGNIHLRQLGEETKMRVDEYVGKAHRTQQPAKSTNYIFILAMLRQDSAQRRHSSA